MRYITTALFILYSTMTATAQVVSITDPPEVADKAAWLVWLTGAAITLLVVLVSSALVYLKSQLDKANEKNERLQGELNDLHKQIQEKFIPALTTATNMFQSMIMGNRNNNNDNTN